MIKWIHHLLNPHCPDCLSELRDSKICDSCEILKMEIERLRIENSKLLDKLLITPSIESVTEPAEFKPILPRNVPWNVKRQILESQDREQAKLIKKQNESVSSSANSNQSSNQNKQSIQALEKELGVEDVS